jgi:hypothetical protein
MSNKINDPIFNDSEDSLEQVPSAILQAHICFDDNDEAYIAARCDEDDGDFLDKLYSER